MGIPKWLLVSNLNLYFYFIGYQFFLLVGSEQLSKDQVCKPLTLSLNQPNVILKCFTKPGNIEESNDCSTPQHSGSVARLLCEEHYTPIRVAQITPQENYYQLWCNPYGEWEKIAKVDEFRCREDCGKLVSKAKPLIINGEVSNRSLFPWHGALFKETKPGTWTYVCGASLIRKQVLVSAAHCFTLDRFISVEPKIFRIVLGSASSEYSLNDESKINGTEIHDIQQIYISDNYDPRKGFQADIAIIQLKRPVKLSEYILPICLPNDFTTDVNAVKNGEMGLVVGFGTTEEGRLSDSLRSASIRVQTTSECQRSLNRVLAESQFCAGESKNGQWVTLCNGDSGGGYVYLSKVFEKYFIHGIVSSGEAKKGTATSTTFCQNYAVFTRIYSFIFWILDKIEEINGEIARELLENVEFPYALRGTETNLAQFTKLPREWENRITSLELEYVTMSRESLLEALVYARPLTSVKLAHVSFFSNSNGSTSLQARRKSNRVILPVLESFYLDIIEDDFKLDKSRSFPIPITYDYFRSLIFFDHEYDSSWTFANIIQRGINIDITIHIFKLLRINHAKGEIFMNQMPFAEEILNAVVEDDEFNIKELGILKSNFTSTSKLWLDLFQANTKMLTLILDEIIIPSNFKSALMYLRTLTNLILNPINKLPIDIIHFPITLKHLSLSQTVQLSCSDIENFQPLLNLETFTCDKCSMDSKVLQYFHEIFPNVQSIYLTSETDIKVPIPSFIKLNSTIISHQKKKLQRNSETEKIWIERNITEIELNIILFNSFGRNYFWTSEGDYRVRLRLKSYELKALESSLYEFSGTKSIQTSYEEFPGIPLELQPSITQIKLQNVDLNAVILANSISNANNLQRVNFIDVLLDDKNLRYNKLKGRNVIYEFKRLVLKNDTIFDYLEEKENGKLLALILPFQSSPGRFGPSKYANTLHRLIVELNSLYIDWKTTVYFMLNVNYGEVRDESTLVVSSFGQVINTNQELREITHSIFKLYDTVVEGILPRDWKFTGFQLLNEEMINGFYQDQVLQFFGRLGIIQVMLKKYGSLITIQGSVDYENLKKPINFPPIPALAASYNQDKID